MGTRQSTGRFHWSSRIGSDSGMVGQGTPVDEPPEPITHNIAALMRDLSRMADLQLQLLSVDLQEFWSGARNRIVVASIALTITLGSIPVFLFALARFIERHTVLRTESAQFLVAMVTLLVGAAILWMSIRRIGTAANKMKRSRDELQENLKWIRSVLHRDQE